MLAGAREAVVQERSRLRSFQVTFLPKRPGFRLKA